MIVAHMLSQQRYSVPCSGASAGLQPQTTSTQHCRAAAVLARPAACHGCQKRRRHCCGSAAAAAAARSSNSWRTPLRTWRLVAVSDSAGAEAGSAPLVAVEGDIVTLNWKCFNAEGELLESSKQKEDPTTFEVGTGDIVGNRLYEAFDEAVRGMAVGDMTRIKAEGGEWKEELLFRVPREHPEMERLAGRYKNHGGLKEGLVVELANGGMALVIKADDEVVVLDANNMLAGKTLWFELVLANIDRPTAAT